MRCSYNKVLVDFIGNLELGRFLELFYFGVRGLGFYFFGKGRYVGRFSFF